VSGSFMKEKVENCEKLLVKWAKHEKVVPE
jgi:hypothetical protein